MQVETTNSKKAKSPISSNEIVKGVIGSIMTKIIIALLGSLTTIFAISATRVPDNKVVVKYRFNRLIEGPVSPGLHFFFPYIHNIEEYDVTLRTLTVTDLEGAEGKVLPSINVITKDKYQVKILAYLQYTLNKNLPKNGKSITTETLRMVETYGPKGDTIADKKIQRAIKDKVRTEVVELASKHDLEYMLDNPKALNEKIFLNLTSNKQVKSENERLLKESGILIKNFSLTVTPPESYVNLIAEERKVTETIESEDRARKLMEEKNKTYDYYVKNKQSEENAKLIKQRFESEINNLLPVQLIIEN